MDDPRVLKIITVGLVLAALAVGYFLLTGGFAVKPKKVQTQTTQFNKVVASPTPAVGTVATPSAYSRIAERSQGSVQILPNTGFSVGLIVVFSTSAIVSGWFLRKYPH